MNWDVLQNRVNSPEIQPVKKCTGIPCFITLYFMHFTNIVLFRN